MKYLLFLSISIIVQTSSAQLLPRQIDSIVESSRNFENDGSLDKANKVNESLLTLITEDNVYYGDALYSILRYYLMKNKMEIAYKYYEKIITSGINDKESDATSINEPYKNYRYRATKLMGEYYHKHGDLTKCLEYIDMLEYSIPYYTTLLSSFKAEKIDLATSRAKIYDELNSKDTAFYFLLKRALEHDYEFQFPNFTSNHKCGEEKLLTEQIFSYYPTGKALKEFKVALDASINAIEVKKKTNTSKIKMDYNGLTYILQVNFTKETIEEYIEFLQKAPMYKTLTEKTSVLKY